MSVDRDRDHLSGPSPRRVADWVCCEVEGHPVAFFVPASPGNGGDISPLLPNNALCLPVRSLGRDSLGEPALRTLTHALAAPEEWCLRQQERLSSELGTPFIVRALACTGQPEAAVASLQPATSRAPKCEHDDQPAVLDGGQLEIAPGSTCLTDLLEQAARFDKGISFVGADEAAHNVTYHQLWEAAQSVAGGLRARGVEPQQVVVLQLREARDFLPAFWGCVLCGAVPVPCGIPADLESAPSRNQLPKVRALLGDPPVITGAAGGWDLPSLMASPIEHPHRAAPDDLAVLLLTSGSTGTPRLVRQSHGAILSRCAGSKLFNGFGAEDVSLNWFPLDHVGGLLMFHVHDVFLGCQQVQGPLPAVLADPTRWLDWIERFRVTITWAPNFAFALVAARESAIRHRRWDLSSLRFILNGGEAIVARHAQRFMSLLRAHGLRTDAMHPAWGMTETCSGVTYEHAFASIPPNAQRVRVGAPIAGTSIRVVDDSGDVVSCGDEGHLQVKGASVTSGYHCAPEATAQAFTTDGWFKTGDRGVIDAGALTITGRDRDVIIINGLNVSCSEVEAVVEELSEVAPATAIAMAFREPTDPTDRLVVAFTPQGDAPADLPESIRDHVLRRLAVCPSRVLPVGFYDVPRTAIGKIQRAALLEKLRPLITGSSTRRQEGSCGVFRPTFRRRDRDPAPAPRDRRALVLCQPEQVAALEGSLSAMGIRYVIAAAGASASIHASDGDAHFLPEDPEDYRRLIATTWARLGGIDHVIHTLCCAPRHSLRADVTQELSSAIAAVERDCGLAGESLLHLLHTIDAFVPQKQRIAVTFATEAAQVVLPGDVPHYTVGTAFGLLKTARAEYRWLDARAVDFDALAPDVLIDEIAQPGVDDVVAYRSGARWVMRLSRASDPGEQPKSLPYTEGDLVLITGGLGGVGFEVARHLLQEKRARLLIVGRTSLPERATFAAHRDGPFAEAIERLQALEALGPVSYAAVDITRVTDLEVIVAAAELEHSRPLRAAFHLALDLAPGPISDITVAHLRAAVRAKCLGAISLHSILCKRSGSTMVSLSSVTGFFGGAGFAAYAGACSLLDSFGDWQRATSRVQNFTLGFSSWRGIGLSRRYKSDEAAAARGLQTLDVETALLALQARLGEPASRVLLGLDGEHAAIVAQRCDVPVLSDEVEIRCGSAAVPKLERWLESAPLRDALNRPVTPRLLVDDAIARQRTPAAYASLVSFDGELTAIWKELLELDNVEGDDNFFDLGGHSLVIPRMQEAIQRRLGLELPVVTFFKYPTLALLAGHIAESAGQQAPIGELVGLQNGRDERNAGIAALRAARGA
ncbi:MAG TPA: AMP-binding protein [Polyangiaceae bacterium]|nr:AMP-binding protein [Polyangiaceae bacterium]